MLYDWREDEVVGAYLRASAQMRKVVKECKGETQLLKLATALEKEGIAHRLWVEQPENIPTAIALKPYPRSQVQHLVKKYSLFR